MVFHLFNNSGKKNNGVWYPITRSWLCLIAAIRLFRRFIASRFIGLLCVHLEPSIILQTRLFIHQSARCCTIETSTCVVGAGPHVAVLRCLAAAGTGHAAQEMLPSDDSPGRLLRRQFRIPTTCAIRSSSGEPSPGCTRQRRSTRDHLYACSGTVPVIRPCAWDHRPLVPSGPVLRPRPRSSCAHQNWHCHSSWYCCCIPGYCTILLDGRGWIRRRGLSTAPSSESPGGVAPSGDGAGLIIKIGVPVVPSGDAVQESSSVWRSVPGVNRTVWRCGTEVINAVSGVVRQGRYDPQA